MSILLWIHNNTSEGSNHLSNVLYLEIGNNSKANLLIAHSHTLPQLLESCVINTRRGISQSADMDHGLLGRQPHHYCLLVVYRKYAPLCFLWPGTPPPATPNHIQLNKPASPVSCGEVIQTPGSRLGELLGLLHATKQSHVGVLQSFPLHIQIRVSCCIVL